MIADDAIQSGEIGAYLQMRDTILPQAQTQLDEFANQDVAGAVEPDRQRNGGHVRRFERL